jgi:hypothetical protein
VDFHILLSWWWIEAGRGWIEAALLFLLFSSLLSMDGSSFGIQMAEQQQQPRMEAGPSSFFSPSLLKRAWQCNLERVHRASFSAFVSQLTYWMQQQHEKEKGGTDIYYLSHSARVPKQINYYCSMCRGLQLPSDAAVSEKYYKATAVSHYNARETW